MSKSNDAFIDEQEFRHKELLETGKEDEGRKILNFIANDWRDMLGTPIGRERACIDDPRFNSNNNPLG